MSCEQPRQVYAKISKSLGRSQLVHRRVAHDSKYGLSEVRINMFWPISLPSNNHPPNRLINDMHCLSYCECEFFQWLSQKLAVKAGTAIHSPGWPALSAHMFRRPTCLVCNSYYISCIVEVDIFAN